jgi:hypothetical protein
MWVNNAWLGRLTAPSLAAKEWTGRISESTVTTITHNGTPHNAYTIEFINYFRKIPCDTMSGPTVRYQTGRETVDMVRFSQSIKFCIVMFFYPCLLCLSFAVLKIVLLLSICIVLTGLKGGLHESVLTDYAVVLCWNCGIWGRLTILLVGIKGESHKIGLKYEVWESLTFPAMRKNNVLKGRLRGIFLDANGGACLVYGECVQLSLAGSWMLKSQPRYSHGSRERAWNYLCTIQSKGVNIKEASLLPLYKGTISPKSVADSEKKWAKIMGKKGVHFKNE